VALTIASLPFEERPIAVLLDLEVARDAPSRDYEGFGWARGATLWLEAADGTAQRVDDALVIALHTADDAEAIEGDLELELTLPERSVTVLASAFLERWLPKLPASAAVVLAICNPHHTMLRRPAAATGPIYFGRGDVASWRETDRVILTAEDWCTI
jgi:hypothetical protein